MKLDFATFSFGYSLKVGGGTPNWATSLGQGKEYKINEEPDINEILKGMIYSSVELSKISMKIGKGGHIYHGNEPEANIVLSGVFSKVFVNDIKINNGYFVLIITRDTSESHTGRLRLKYGPSNTYEINGKEYSNELFISQVKAQLSLAPDSCWFVSEINVRNQDELVLKTHIVNSKGSVIYEDTKEHHEAWGKFAPCDLQSNETDNSNKKTFCLNSNQIIYYGVPGSGKSHKIDEKIKSIPDTQKMRVVFHPDYSNADFIGQILPVMLDDGVEYRFKAGPFSRILKRALKNPSEPHYLIIEEINRGNAAAIFGDLFQLLDRSESGWSNYQIENLDLNAFIRSSDNTYSDKKIATPTVKVGNDDWDENTGIRFPPNLSILATMNTSDQNVFTLDNAFQRRWDMQLVENNFGDTEEETKQRNAIIEGSNPEITWETFQTAINEKIASTSSEMGLSSLEDKRLGCWFVKAEKNTEGKFIIKKDVFANKVLKYLWDDAFKFSRDKIFEKCSNFEELKSKFEQKGFEIFKQDLQNEFHKNKDYETSSE